LDLAGEDFDDLQRGHADFDGGLQLTEVFLAGSSAVGHDEKLIHLGLARCIENGHVYTPWLNGNTIKRTALAAEPMPAVHTTPRQDHWAHAKLQRHVV